MKRNVSLEEISDGRLYSKNDMAKVGCGDCRGCCSCCKGMGNSVILDPYDIYRLTVLMGSTFEELMQGKIELNVVDGVILPNLAMSNETETCAFLNEQGRCSIHAYRPGICRLFPLGRYYETRDYRADGICAKALQMDSEEYSDSRMGKVDDRTGVNFVELSEKKKRGFHYFLQIHECPAPNKTKVKIEKWVDTPHLPRYEQFICEWHYFLEAVELRIAEETEDLAIKNINLFLLKLFFIQPYQKTDFYEQFEGRLQQAKDILEISADF